jgi:hypothetical protein
MAISYPPQYRYSLFEPWDKKAFRLIKQVGQTKNYPKILGTKKDKNQFLISLIRTKKALHDWRDFLVEIFHQVENTNSIDTRSLNEKYPPENISKDEPDWVTYKEDRIVSNFIDELETKKIDFIGSEKEVAEFVMRFILGQLGHDWEWTIMMIWEMLGNENKLSVKSLNNELKNFDYLKLFE